MVNDRTFDAAAFMQQNVDAPMETEYKLCPEGDFAMMIDDFDPEKAVEVVDFKYKKGTRAGQDGSMTKFNVPCIITDEAVKAEMKRDKVVVMAQLIIDTDELTGGLAVGQDKNVKLGQIRKAVGQNAPGPWSPMNLRGAGPFMGHVKHVPYEQNGETRKRAEVVRFVPLR